MRHTLHCELTNTKAISSFSYLAIFIESLYISEAVKLQKAVRQQSV